MPTTTQPISVIILNYNGLALMRRYLPSVVTHTPAAARLIVADNGSTDDSLQWLEKEYPDVEILAFDRNYGFAEGYNKALAAVNTRYTLLLNSDVRVSEDYVTPLYDFMESHPGCAACQPKILSDRDPDSFEYAGASGGFLDRDGYPYCRGRVFDCVERDNGQYDTPLQVHWASGAALMVRTADYLASGGLDKGFFAHMEEIDLCWRLRLAGKQVWVVPKARVYHLGGGSLAMGDPRKTFLNFRNSLRMMHKNLPPGVRPGKLFRRRLLDTLAMAKFVLTGQFKQAQAVLKAHLDYREWKHSAPDVSPAENLLAGEISILSKRYLHRIKRFSDL